MTSSVAIFQSLLVTGSGKPSFWAHKNSGLETQYIWLWAPCGNVMYHTYSMQGHLQWTKHIFVEFI